MTNYKLQTTNYKLLFLLVILSFLFFNISFARDVEEAYPELQTQTVQQASESYQAQQSGTDQPCLNISGVCMINSGPSSCVNGEFRAGLCSGPTNRQCCVKKESGSSSGGTDTFQKTTGGTDTFQKTGGIQTIKIPNPLNATSFTDLISRIINWLLIIGAPILTLMIIIGAFQILTAAGNSEKVTAGRHTITYAVIGYALLLISTGIIDIIKNLFGAK